MVFPKSDIAAESAKLSQGRTMSNTNDTRFDAQLRISAYQAITDLLAENKLITKQDERRIRKRISKMQDALIRPDKNPHTHDRDLSTL